MADTTPTDWTKLGAKTSEFMVTAAGFLSGLFTIAASIYECLSQIHQQFPQSQVVSAVTALVGGLLAVGSVLGYNKSRSVVKATMGAVDAAAASAGQPLVFAKQAPLVVKNP